MLSRPKNVGKIRKTLKNGFILKLKKRNKNVIYIYDTFEVLVSQLILGVEQSKHSARQSSEERLNGWSKVEVGAEVVGA